jgi:hypothetical protein
VIVASKTMTSSFGVTAPEPIVSVCSVSVGAESESFAGVAVYDVGALRGTHTSGSSGVECARSTGAAAVASVVVSAVGVDDASVAGVSVAVVVSVVVGAGAGAAGAGGVAAGGGAGYEPTVLSMIGVFANGSGFGFAFACFGCGRVTYKLLATGTRTLRR